MSEPIWVQSEQVVELHQIVAEQAGKPYHLKDFGLLDSACSVPINKNYYGQLQDVYALAVELMLAIAQNHPFDDGNKRAAFMAGMLFMRQNGHETTVEDTIAFSKLLQLVIAHLVEQDLVVEWLRHGEAPAGLIERVEFMWDRMEAEL